MLLHLAFLFASIFGNPSIPPVVKDSFEINEADYRGYIMPLESYTRTKFVSDSIHYVPLREEVQKAEKLLKQHLDSFCMNYDTTVDFDKSQIINPNDYDCKIIKTQFKNYFRQYAGYIKMKNHHRIVYILCVSRGQQTSLDKMKCEWMDRIGDGGPILFHAYIDLETGEVWFHDNGWG
jgi:hypothetical protein